MADVKFAVIRHALSDAIASPNTDFTEAGFGTPKGAIVIVSYANTTNNPAAHFSLSIGFWDGTNRNCANVYAFNAATPKTDTWRVASTDKISIISTYANWDIENIENGVRLVMESDDILYAVYATVILIGGNDASCNVGTFTPNASVSGTASVSSLAYEPDVLFFTCVGHAFPQIAENINVFSFGVCANDGSNTQRCLLMFSNDNVSEPQTGTRIENDSCCGKFYDDTLSWTGEITSFNADGFTMTTRDAVTGGDVVGYMAINLGGEGCYMTTLTTPALDDGEYSNSSVGFEPKVLIAIGSNVTSINTNTQSLTISAGASDGTQDSSVAVRDEDGAADQSNVDSESNERLIDIRNEADGSDDTYATVSSLDSNGYTLNYGAVSVSNEYLGWILALGGGAADESTYKSIFFPLHSKIFGKFTTSN